MNLVSTVEDSWGHSKRPEIGSNRPIVANRDFLENLR